MSYNSIVVLTSSTPVLLDRIPFMVPASIVNSSVIVVSQIFALRFGLFSFVHSTEGTLDSSNERLPAFSTSKIC